MKQIGSVDSALGGTLLAATGERASTILRADQYDTNMIQI